MRSNKDEAHRRKLNAETDRKPSYGHVFNATFADKYIFGKKVLDIGCWTGQMAQLLAPRAKSYVGFDPSEDAIGFAKKQVPVGKFSVDRAETFTALPKTFDTVVIFDVIEHVPNGTEGKVYKKIYTTLNDNGHLILTTPSSHLLSRLLDPAYFLIGHRHYSEKQLKNALSKAGFRVIHIIKTGNIVSLVWHNLELVCKHVFGKTINPPQFIENEMHKGYEYNGFAEIHLIAEKKSPLRK